MKSSISDPRIDPRIKAAFGPMLDAKPAGNVASRADLLAEEVMLDAPTAAPVGPAGGFAEAAPADDALSVSVHSFASSPDGNEIKILSIRPTTDALLPCVYYIHGGGMATRSCFDDLHQAWGRLIARQGVAVAMVDFRNCLRASSTPEVQPFPAGLNDCVSGVHWLRAHSDLLRIDPQRIVVAGESGGGNLALATGMKLKRDGAIGLIKGIYALCPYIAGEWPLAENPSSVENNGILIDVHDNRSAMAYGIEAFEARDPLAWRGFATAQDVTGLPPTVISVNECDPLRDEGINFYRLMLNNAVSARCRQMMGTTHGAEVFMCCPDISHDTARDIAGFARD